MLDQGMNRREFLRVAGGAVAGTSVLGLAACGGGASPATVGKNYGKPAADPNWTLKKAAEPFKGIKLKGIFLDRPGYRAAAKLLPEFQDATGIQVSYDVVPYENTHEKQVLDFTGRTKNYDLVLIDLVWIGEFASSGWTVPLSKFWTDSKLADPQLKLDGFFPVLLDAFGTWDKVVYGLPFDNYGGLTFYNKRQLREAGFDRPPQSWQELYDKYAPALSKGSHFGYALQSRRGETQSADSFMRMVWQAGGSLLDPKKFEPQLHSQPSSNGLEFRQKLLKYMPPDVVEWDHDEAVQGLAQGRVGIITEWSANYSTLADPSTSTISQDLGVALEPAGADGQPHPALGGFSLGINSAISEEKQKAAYLFIQWINSEAKSKDYIRAGGVSARQGAYQDPELQQKYPYFAPLVTTWNKYGNPIFRPRFAEWPRISELIAQFGSEMELGHMSVSDGIKRIEDQMKPILAPYLNGKKPTLQ